MALLPLPVALTVGASVLVVAAAAPVMPGAGRTSQIPSAQAGLAQANSAQAGLAQANSAPAAVADASPASGMPSDTPRTRITAGAAPSTGAPPGPLVGADVSTGARAFPAVPPHGRWRWPLSPAPPVLRPFVVGPYRWSPGHRGVDLGGSPGQSVLAPAAGVVTFAGMVAGRPVLVIRHDGGIRTSYEPVVAAVHVGQPVAAGERVAVLARGHCAVRGCLHWGARRWSTYVDPLGLLGVHRRVVLLPLGGT